MGGSVGKPEPSFSELKPKPFLPVVVFVGALQGLEEKRTELLPSAACFEGGHSLLGSPLSMPHPEL